MVTVTAAIIAEGDRVLVCQRRRDAAMPLKWEFPGGKVEDREGLADSLRRELREELGIEARIGGEVYRTRHRYPGREEVELVFFRVEAYEGVVRNRAFEDVRWVPRAELPGYDFLEADRVLVREVAAGRIL